MTILWCEKDQALEEFSKQLLPWVQTSALRDLYSAAETKEYVGEAVKWAFMGGSRTALDLYHFILRAKEPIWLVGMKGGFQCFGSEEGLRGNLRTVFLDIDGLLNINQRVSRSEHNLVLTDTSSGAPKFTVSQAYAIDRDGDHVAPREFVGNVVSLNNKIAALHELGHAKQCIERPDWFAAKVKGKANPRLKPEKGGPTAFSAEIQQKAETRAQRVVGSTAHIGTKEELAAFASAPPAWDPVIEMDNMARHEWPICREMKIGYRKNYCDLTGTTGALGCQVSTLITRKIQAIEERERREKEQGDPALKAAAQGAAKKHVCPLTKQEFAGMKIKMHKLSCPTCKAMD